MDNIYELVYNCNARYYGIGMMKLLLCYDDVKVFEREEE